MTAPTLLAARSARGLAGRGSRDASPLSPVQTCAGRFGAAGFSPEGAGLAWGGPALAAVVGAHVMNLSAHSKILSS